jgi:hypothetical protein
MADRISLFAVDDMGAPATGLTPSFVKYVDRTGTTRTPPAITASSVAGEYVFSPSQADEDLGVCWLVDLGTTSGGLSRRVSGTVPLFTSFECFHLEDGAGALWTGAAPTWGGYADFAGNARAAPTLAALGNGLYTFTPSPDDLTLDVTFRLDSPVGAYPAYVAGSPEARKQPTPAPSTGLDAEGIVVRALREYLLANLPGKVAQLNALRGAALKSALVEPFTVPASASLVLSTTGRDSGGVTVALPSGSQTASAIAATINAAVVPNVTASTDAGRLVLTSTVTPAVGTLSLLSLQAGTGNAAFGWDAGGEHVTTSALVAPSWRGITDGWPLAVPDMGSGFWVILGDRESVPVDPDVRRDEILVTLEVTLLKMEAATSPHRSREGITSCLRAVRELLLTSTGRYLGRVGSGDVLFAAISKANIPGRPFSFVDKNGASVVNASVFDAATFTLTCRVYQRPAF